MITTNVIFKLRRDTTTNWNTYNPVLQAGEIGIDTVLNKFKIGNGSSVWSALAYGSILASELTAAITSHNSTTTNVHGIADTAALATKTYSDSAVSTAIASEVTARNSAISTAKSEAITTASTDATSKVSTHNSTTTNIHGIADTAALALTSNVNSALVLKAPIASPTFTGTVSGVTKAMVGLGNVDNTTDAAKPISTATQAAIDLKAPLASPSLTGVPTAPTAIATTNTNQLATTEFVKTAVANLIAAAPTALDTLSELATALGNDANFSTTITNSLALKAPIASPTFTGTVSGITKSMVGLSNVDNTSDMNKPVSTAQSTYINSAITSLSNTAATSYVPQSDVGNSNGVASLDDSGYVPTSQLGNINLSALSQVASFNNRLINLELGLGI